MGFLDGNIEPEEELFEVDEAEHDVVSGVTDESNIQDKIPTNGDPLGLSEDEEDLFDPEEELVSEDGGETVATDETEEDPEEEGEGEATEETTEEDGEDDTVTLQLEALGEMGIEISKEELEAQGGDVSKAVELHTIEKANILIDNVVGNLGSEEKDLVTKLLEGVTVADLNIGIPSSEGEFNYSEEEIEENPDIQKALAEKRYVEVNGFTPAKAKKIAEALGDELFEEAVEAQKELKALHKERVDKPIRERKAALKAQEEQRTKTIADINAASAKFFEEKSFGDIKLPKAIRTKSAAEQFKTWERLASNLATYMPRLAVLDQLGLLEGKTDKISSSAVNAGKKALTKLIKTKTKPSSTGKTKEQLSDEEFRNNIASIVKSHKR